MNKSNNLNIIVAGAGIGGLSAAAGLIAAGHKVRIFEAAPQLGEVGAGIQLSANALKVLFNLGLKEQIEAVAFRPEHYNFRVYDSGEILQSMPLGSTHEARFGAPYLQIHRADIHQILVDKVLSLDPTAITLDSEVCGYEESDTGISIKLKNGEQHSADLLVGADGIKSVIRNQLIGGQSSTFTGQVAWRITVPSERLPTNLLGPNMDVWCGPGSHAVSYYVRNGEIANFVGCVRREDWQQEGWTIKCPWEELKADFAGWHPIIQHLIDATDKDACFRWALNNREALPYWSLGRATLLGDACHPTLPYLAQGAAMAIEDSAVLTRCLARGEELSVALDVYQRNRIDRTTRIVNESTENAEFFQHNTVKELNAAFAQRDIDQERTEWLYSYDALKIELG